MNPWIKPVLVTVGTIIQLGTVFLFLRYVERPWALQQDIWKIRCWWERTIDYPTNRFVVDVWEFLGFDRFAQEILRREYRAGKRSEFDV